MKTDSKKALVALLVTLLAVASHGATIITAWHLDDGTAPTSGLTTPDPVFGDGSNNSADDIAVSGEIFGGVTAANVDDTIQVTGTLILEGITKGQAAGQLGFGLFNTNGSSNSTGWLGYMATASDKNNPGPLYERTVGNTSLYTSLTGATQISSATATGGPDLTDGTYSFTITVTRLPSNALSIGWTLTRTSLAGYSLSGSFTDTTVNTFTFDRVGFDIGNSLNADQFSLSNVSVALIPEPTSSALLVPGLLVLMRRRRQAANGRQTNHPLHESARTQTLLIRG